MSPNTSSPRQDAAPRAIIFLFLFVLSHAYETDRATGAKEAFINHELKEREPCCPCPAKPRRMGQTRNAEDCCSCEVKLGRANPLEFSSRDPSYFLNVATDTSLTSCELIVGDILSSPPSCVSYAEDRVDCFYVNAATQTVFHKTILNGEAQQSVDTVGTVRDEVVAVAVSKRKFMLVALNQSNHLISRVPDRNGWTDWTTIGDVMALEVPSTFMRPSGSVTCFYRDLHNTLWSIDSARYGGWNRPRQLDIDSMASAPTCLERGDDESEECFVLNAGNSVARVQWKYGENWNVLKGLGGLGKLKISVTSSNVDRLDIFVLGKDNQLMHRALIEEKWENWEDLGGNFISAPECVAMEDGVLHCFVIGADRTLKHKKFDGTSWSDWASSAQSHIEKPSCVVTSSTTIACYSRGYTGNMIQSIYSV